MREITPHCRCSLRLAERREPAGLAEPASPPPAAASCASAARAAKLQQMCGRYTNAPTWRQIVELYRVTAPGPEAYLDQLR